MSKATSESEHLKDMLVGNILAVSWPEVRKTALLYGGIGLFHYIFRRQFFAVTEAHHSHTDPPVCRSGCWDFLFYASFGFVVTSSVSIAGVLLVFCYLIVPSVAAMLYAESVGRRLAIGWSMGTLVSALGVYLSLKLDLPTGATIVCTFGLVLIIMRPLCVRSFNARAGLKARPSIPRAGLPTGPSLMQCKNCGAEIADKALICYKCGTATTEARYQPAKLPTARHRPPPARSS